MGLFRSTRTDNGERLAPGEGAELLVTEAFAVEVVAGFAGAGSGGWGMSSNTGILRGRGLED